jgi:hypothetical protein
MNETLRRQNSPPFLAKFPLTRYYVYAAISQKALVDESELIRAQMGTQNRSGNGRSAWDALYDTNT